MADILGSYWNPGDSATFREVLNLKVVCARPVTVVQDTPELTALLLAPGVECKISALFLKVMAGNAPRASRWDEQSRGEWSMDDTIWRRLRVLKLMRPGDYYAVWVCWQHDNDEFVGWYVNFQTPFVRSPIGFDTFDLEVDLNVAPNLIWEWKDEAEYQEGIKWGVISNETAHEVEKAKSQSLALVESRSWPFDESWTDWKSNDTWELPHIHPSWNVVSNETL